MLDLDIQIPFGLLSQVIHVVLARRRHRKHRLVVHTDAAAAAAAAATASAAALALHAVIPDQGLGEENVMGYGSDPNWVSEEASGRH